MAQNSEHALALAFPAVDAGIQPFGSRVLVQIRNPREVTQSGIILTCDTKDTDKWNTTTAKVISVGPLAFKNRNTMAAWPEGDWCAPGEYVRVPKYGGDRWEVAKSDAEVGLFVILNDLDIIGRITGDPLAIRAFI